MNGKIEQFRRNAVVCEERATTIIIKVARSRPAMARASDHLERLQTEISFRG
jgi:hypothetical protein